MLLSWWQGVSWSTGSMPASQAPSCPTATPPRAWGRKSPTLAARTRRTAPAVWSAVERPRRKSGGQRWRHRHHQRQSKQWFAITQWLTWGALYLLVDHLTIDKWNPCGLSQLLLCNHPTTINLVIEYREHILSVAINNHSQSKWDFTWVSVMSRSLICQPKESYLLDQEIMQICLRLTQFVRVPPNEILVFLTKFIFFSPKRDNFMGWKAYYPFPNS